MEPLPLKTLLEEGFPENKIGTFKIYEPVGCENCNGGYKGRVGIYEVVTITKAVSRIIMEEGNALQLNDQFQKEGFNNLRQSALMKAAQGVTSLEEVNRITSEH